MVGYSAPLKEHTENLLLGYTCNQTLTSPLFNSYTSDAYVLTRSPEIVLLF